MSLLFVLAFFQKFSEIVREFQHPTLAADPADPHRDLSFPAGKRIRTLATPKLTQTRARELPALAFASRFRTQQAMSYSYKYSISKNKKDLMRIISLRTEIYQQAGKHMSDQPMTDKFDDGAYLVGIWSNDELIGSARVICKDPNEEWEHDRFIEWDQRLPPRHDCCEISRFCIKTKHRNWWAIRSLCLGISEAMLRSRRHHFIACCTDEFVSFYRNFFGAKFLNSSFCHDDLGDKIHHLFTCNYCHGLAGKDVSFFHWSGLWPTALRIARQKHSEMLPEETFLLKARYMAGMAAEYFCSSLIAKSRGD